LIVPNATRWNPFYNAVDKIRQVIDSNPEDVITVTLLLLMFLIFAQMIRHSLRSTAVLCSRLANALDILQADFKCFFGYILPTLTSLRCKLTAMKPNLKIAGPLVDAILHGLNTRFEGFETHADALLSTVTLPQFRLRWLEDNKKNQVRSLLHVQVRLVAQQQSAVGDAAVNLPYADG
jgi:hypothetical protein